MLLWRYTHEDEAESFAELGSQIDTKMVLSGSDELAVAENTPRFCFYDLRADEKQYAVRC